MRIATGAFKSSPIASLQVLLKEKPLQLRRELAAIKYFFKQRLQLKNPAIRLTMVVEQKVLYISRQVTAPFAIRTRK